MKVFLIYIVVLSIGYLYGNRNWALFVFAFVLLNPMRSLVSQEEYILTRISPDNLANFGLLIAFFTLNRPKLIRYITLPKQLKIGLIILIYFVFIINYYIRIKNILIIETEDSIQLFQIFRDVLIIISVVIIARSIYDEKIFIAVESAILLGSIIIGISISFPDLVNGIGLKTGFEVSDRYSGFLSLNPNSAGVYASIIIGYCLAMVSSRMGKANLGYYLCISIMMVSIMNTGSRQALITTVLVFMFFIYSNYKLLTSKYLIISILVVFAISIFIYNNIESRMQERVIEAIDEEGGSLVSRKEHWQAYIQDLKDNPSYFLIGNINDKPTKYGHHNYYLMLLWSTGVFNLTLFIFLMYKLWKVASEKKIPYKFDIRLILIPVIIASIVNSYTLNLTFILIIFLSTGFARNNYHVYNIVK